MRLFIVMLLLILFAISVATQPKLTMIKLDNNSVPFANYNEEEKNLRDSIEKSSTRQISSLSDTFFI